MFLLSRKLPLDKNTKTNSKCFQRKITDYFNKAQILNINLHSPLHELLLWAEAVLFVHPPLDAAIDDLLDQLLPDSFAQHAAHRELIISNKILSLDFETRFKSSQQISLKDHSYFFIILHQRRIWKYQRRQGVC